MRKSPFFPPYPLPSHSLDCRASLKLFPVFWTTPLSEEPWPAGFIGLRRLEEGVPAQCIPHSGGLEGPEALQQLCVRYSDHSLLLGR